MNSLGSIPLENLENPILLAVCKISQFNYSRANSLGYNYSSNYFAGTTNKANVLSWTGIEGNLSFNETFRFLYNSRTSNIYITTDYITYTDRILIPFGLCKVYEVKPSRQIEVKFLEDNDMFEYAVYVSDPAAATSIQLPYSLYTGERINIKTTGKATMKKFLNYNIQLKEISDVTDDGSCMNYPNQKHKSYSDCVDAEMRELSIPALGCIVPWMPGKNKCNGKIQRLTKHKDFVNWLSPIISKSWGGIQYKSVKCSLSCTVLSAHSAFEVWSKECFKTFHIFYTKI